MHCQKPDRDQSGQKTHFCWHVRAVKKSGIGSKIFGREFDFIDHGSILTAGFLILKILTWYLYQKYPIHFFSKILECRHT